MKLDVVICAENDEEGAKTLKAMVKDLGHHPVGVFKQTSSALESIREENPDLVLIEIFPGGTGSGIEMAKKIRQEFTIPIILINGEMGNKLQEEVKSFPESPILNRPIDIEKFKIAIGDIIEQPVISQSHRSKNILLLDDDEEAANLIRGCSEEIDCWDIAFEHIIEVNDALDFLRNNDVDIFLLDYYLNNTTALEVLETMQLRQLRLPTIILTDEGPEDLAAEVLRAGADDCRSKPDIDSAELLHAVLYVTRKFEHEQAIQEAAHKDGLTGLLRRSRFMAQFREELIRTCRHNRKLCYLMLDLDEFKQVNDVHGHIVGDQVLMKIAKIIKKTIRVSDFAGRYGGDEIAIVLPETGDDKGFLLAERLSKKINNEPLKTSAGDIPINMSVSVGLAEFDGSKHEQITDLILRDVIDRSDRALYMAKQTGVVERRRESRKRVESMTLILEDDLPIEALLIDYSENGARLEVPRKPDCDEVIIKHSGKENVERKATVQWSAEVSPQGPYEIGVAVDFPEVIVGSDKNDPA